MKVSSINKDIDKPAREFGPDLLKAVSILGVVCIHALWVVPSPANEVLQRLSRFAVPCFIVLWAYFFELGLSRGKPPLSTTIRRLLHLVSVFIIWSLIHLTLKPDWTMPTALSWVVRHFSGGAWPGQYFFLLLIQLTALFVVLRVLFEFRWLRWLLIATAAISYFIMAYGYDWIPLLFRKLDLRPFFYSIPFIYLGIALQRKMLPRVPLYCIASILLIPLEFLLLERLQLGHSNYILPSVLLSSVLVSAAVLTNHIPEPSSKLLKLGVSAIGRNTLMIFVANPIVIYFLQLFLFKGALSDLPFGWDIAAIIGVSLITSWICIGLAYLFRLCRLEGIAS